VAGVAGYATRQFELNRESNTVVIDDNERLL